MAKGALSTIAGLEYETPMWDYLRAMGIPEESIGYRQREYEGERGKGYLPRRALNVEEDPGNYMLVPPDRVETYDEWRKNPKTAGGAVAGYHNFLSGIVIPERHHWNTIGEVLTHEGQHALINPEILDPRRKEAQKSVLERFREYLDNLSSFNRPHGISGQDSSDELVPQMMAYEAYLPAGARLTNAELGAKLLQTPEEKLWWLSRRYPKQKDPEGPRGALLDAVTSAAPR